MAEKKEKNIQVPATIFVIFDGNEATITKISYETAYISTEKFPDENAELSMKLFFSDDLEENYVKGKVVSIFERPNDEYLTKGFLVEFVDESLVFQRKLERFIEKEYARLVEKAKNDKRQHLRYKETLHVKIKYKNIEIQGNIINMSLGGLLFETKNNFKTTDTLTFEISHPVTLEKFQLHGNIVRKNRLQSTENEKKFEYGIEFSETTWEEKKLLKKCFEIFSTEKDFLTKIINESKMMDNLVEEEENKPEEAELEDENRTDDIKEGAQVEVTQKKPKILDFKPHFIKKTKSLNPKQVNKQEKQPEKPHYKLLMFFLALALFMLGLFEEKVYNYMNDINPSQKEADNSGISFSDTSGFSEKDRVKFVLSKNQAIFNKKSSKNVSFSVSSPAIDEQAEARRKASVTPEMIDAEKTKLLKKYELEMKKLNSLLNMKNITPDQREEVEKKKRRLTHVKDQIEAFKL